MGATTHQLEVGSILCCKWGYDQTKVDFYEVIRLCGKTMIEVRQIDKRKTSDHGEAHYKVTPVPGYFRGDAFRRKVCTHEGWGDRQYTGINVSSFSSAFVWDGTPQLETDSRYGH